MLGLDFDRSWWLAKLAASTREHEILRTMRRGCVSLGGSRGPTLLLIPLPLKPPLCIKPHAEIATFKRLLQFSRVAQQHVDAYFAKDELLRSRNHEPLLPLGQTRFDVVDVDEGNGARRDAAGWGVRSSVAGGGSMFPGLPVVGGATAELVEFA
jgi:hypothetical protein